MDKIFMMEFFFPFFRSVSKYSTPHVYTYPYLFILLVFSPCTPNEINGFRVIVKLIKKVKNVMKRKKINNNK